MSLSPRWKKIITDTWGHKLRSALVIASITIGLFAVGLIASMQIILNQDMTQGYSAVNPANIELAVSPFDKELVDRIAKLDGVRQAEGAAAYSLRYRKADGTWEPLAFQAFPDIASKQINQVRLQQGTWPPQDKQMVVDQYNAG